MADKPKYLKLTTPKGVAVFPWLNKPDTKWKPEGEYRIKLRLTEEQAQPLLDAIQPVYEQSIKDAKEKAAKDPKKKGKKIVIVEQEYYSKVVDDDGEETGEVEFNFKRTASGISKATQKPWSIKPDLFGADGKKLSAEAKVYGGSLCKVSFEVIPYDTPKATGVKLSLAAVQVIKLVEGGRNASQYGFGDESDDDDADAGDFANDEGGAGGEDTGAASGDNF